MIIQFSVPFAVPKGRPHFGKGRAWTPKATSDAEHAVGTAYKGASIRKCGRVVCASKGVPVTVVITVCRKLPKSRPKRIFAEPDTQKPDIDNLTKLVLDALNGLAWCDDSQVTDVHAHKLSRVRDREDTTHVIVMWDEPKEQ